MDVAYALTLLVAVNAPAGAPAHGWEAYYTPGFAYDSPNGYDIGRYRAQSLLPFDLTLSGAAATLFGPLTATGATAVDMGPDTATLESPYMLDEKAIGEETRALGEMSDVGRPISALRATGGERWIFGFEVISPPEEPREIGRTTAERVMGAYYAGRPMRVWRDINVNTAWDIATNDWGYSDIVPLQGDDNSTLPWYDAFRRRAKLEFTGVEVR
jgi:hypothetical protein